MLYPSIFQRMKADHDQSTARRQLPRSGIEPGFKIIQFLIDPDSNALKAAGRRMQPDARLATNGGFDQLGQFPGGAQRR